MTDIQFSSISNTEIINENVISIFPNPTSGLITIVLNELNPNQKIKLYNLTGSFLMEKEITDSNTNLNLKDYETGFYLLELMPISL